MVERDFRVGPQRSSYRVRGGSLRPQPLPPPADSLLGGCEMSPCCCTFMIDLWLINDFFDLETAALGPEFTGISSGSQSSSASRTAETHSNIQVRRKTHIGIMERADGNTCWSVWTGLNRETEFISVRGVKSRRKAALRAANSYLPPRRSYHANAGLGGGALSARFHRQPILWGGVNAQGDGSVPQVVKGGA